MMLLSEAAGYMEGEFLGDEEAWVSSIGSDSRNITKGELFFALKGENFDGHAYAAQAIQQGACAVVISDKNCEVRPAILVKDTLLALGSLAKSWRNELTLPLVAITGSNGKTTVKEMLAAILSSAAGRAVLATQGNLNNHIGMPMTLLKLRKEHAYAVIEMGMNHEGEIRYLSNIAQPNVAVVNNAGTAHIGEVGTREGIARAKGEIFEGLGNDGIAIINADDNFADFWKSLNKNRKILTFALDSAADVTASYQTRDDFSEVQLNTPSGSIGFRLEMLGKHNVSNALAASTCAVALGISNADIARGLTNFGGVKGRLQRMAGLNGAALIDDTYNANPDSMRAAIDVLATHHDSIFVMGDMAELGADAPQMHADIGLYAKQKGIGKFYAFGELSQLAAKQFGANAQHFLSVETLAEAIKNEMKQGVTVLVKGSRFMQMERVVNKIVSSQLVEKNNARETKSCC